MSMSTGRKGLQVEWEIELPKTMIGWECRARDMKDEETILAEAIETWIARLDRTHSGIK